MMSIINWYIDLIMTHFSWSVGIFIVALTGAIIGLAIAAVLYYIWARIYIALHPQKRTPSYLRGPYR